MERPGRWTLLDDARRRLLAVLEPTEPTEVPLVGASGRVLARDVAAPRDVPPFAASAMDGYAVRAADTAAPSVRLRVVGTAGAGRPAEVPVGPGDAVAIATGGALPDGADTICPIEDVTVDDDGGHVTITEAVEPGAYVRPVGSDTAVGEPVFPAGTRLGPAHVGVLAALGMSTVAVHRTVRVGVLATGDELVEPPAVPGPGRIHDANRPAMMAAATAAGCDVVDLGIVGDDPDRLEAAIVDAAGRCDVILTSGGVSVGVADHLKAILARLAPDTLDWMEVRIRPGKPFGFAVLADSGVPVLCLPGNPVSALVVFELLVGPALDRLGGGTGLPRRARVAVADEPFERESDGKMHVVRAVVTAADDGGLHVRSAGGQSSHQLRVLADANGLVLVDDGEPVGVGDRVRVLVVDDATLAGTGWRR